MPRHAFIIAAFFSLILSACGGSGGSGIIDNGGNSNSTGVSSGSSSSTSVSGGTGGSTSLTVAPASLSFSAIEGSPSVDTKTLTANFQGDGLIVGYPIGTPSVAWLIVNNDTFTQSPASIQFGASAQGLTKGIYSTAIRVVTGKDDGTQLKYVDIPVTFTVTGALQSDTGSLSFTTMEGTPPPASQLLKLHSDSLPANWQINIQYNDEAQNWLVPSSLTGVLNSTDSSVSITTKALPSGHYSASILLLDGRGQTRKTIPVVYDVAAGFSITGVTAKAFTEKTSTEDLSWPLTLQTNYDSATGKNLTWQITSDQPWLTVANKAGNFSANQTIQLQVSADQLLQLDNGNLTANLSFSVADANVKSLTIPIQIGLDLQPTLTLSGLSSSSFYVGNNTVATELKKSLNIQTNVGSAFSRVIHWQAVTGASWLTFSKATGDTDSNSTLQLEVDKNELAKLANGSYGAILTLKPDNARYKTVNTTIGLGVNQATVEHVAPYVAYTGRSEPIVIRGQGFGVLASIKVNFGNTQVDATVVNDGEIHVNYPSLASEQRVNVDIKNALNLTRGGAELVYKQVPAYTRQKIRANDNIQSLEYFRNIALDPERNAVLLSGLYANQIGRMRLTETGWKTDSFPAQYAQRAAVTLDGKEILASVGQTWTFSSSTLVHLNPETLAINKSVPITINDSPGTYAHIAPLNDGRTLLMHDDQNSYTMLYPSQQAIADPRIYIAEMVQTRDHSRLLVGSTNFVSDIYSYDSNASEFTHRGLNISQFRANNISMSGDAGRLVAENSVYDHDFNFLGSLSPIVNHFNVAVSPNGKYAYVEARDVPSNYAIKRYNISAPTGPFLEDTSTPAIALAEGEFVVSMTVSDDGNALFALVYSSLEFPNAVYFYVFPLTN